MKTHVFGNSSSPAVAIYGLCRAANHAESEHGANAKLFVEGNLHVDNGLTSLPSATKAINLLKITQMLADSNLRLHKIASKCAKVLEAFPTEDHVLDLRDLELISFYYPTTPSCPLQSMQVGAGPESQERCFNIQSGTCGVLATVNSLFDPLGR